MKLLNDSIRSKWAKVDAICSPFWWVFAVLWLVCLG